MKNGKLKLLICGLATILLIGISGCQVQPIESYYVGLQTPPDKSLPLLKQGIHSGQWETFDLMVNYQYQVENDSLEISGKVTLVNYYQINKTSLRDLELFLFFLDGDSMVSQTVRVLKTLSSDLYASHPFEKNFQIPTATKAISFGYRGSAKGDHPPQIERFDHLPKHSQ